MAHRTWDDGNFADGLETEQKYTYLLLFDHKPVHSSHQNCTKCYTFGHTTHLINLSLSSPSCLRSIWTDFKNSTAKLATTGKIVPMESNIALKKVKSISNALSDYEEDEAQRHRKISSQ